MVTLTDDVANRGTSAEVVSEYLEDTFLKLYEHQLDRMDNLNNSLNVHIGITAACISIISIMATKAVVSIPNILSIITLTILFFALVMTIIAGNDIRKTIYNHKFALLADPNELMEYLKSVRDELVFDGKWDITTIDNELRRLLIKHYGGAQK